MNMQQAVQPRSSSNGYVRRKVERETLLKFDNKLQIGKPNSSRTNYGKGCGLHESPSRDRLLYMTTCLIGHQVEVQVADGSVFAGIFHAFNSEDCGIVLKMAHLIRDASQGKKYISDFATKPLAKTFIIPAEDFVQVIAKGVPVTKDGLTNELLREKQQELMTDSCISQSRHVELGRELEPWIPDENDPVCPELDNTFDAPWNRGWDQFEANETLFGVKSTFDEELYTTKLERGPRTFELERVATQLAREIEGEDTLDLHLAEERGLPINKNLEVDEETRYSSVVRRVDDSGYDEIEDILLDSQNDETFGGLSDSTNDKPVLDENFGDSSTGAKIQSRSSSMGERRSLQASMSSDVYNLGLEDKVGPPLYEQPPRDRGNQMVNAESIGSKDDTKKQLVLDRSQVSKAHDSWMISKEKGSEKIALSPDATAFDPSHPSAKVHEKESSFSELPESAIHPKAQGTASHLGRPGSAASSTSDRGGAASTSAGRGLSSSSSISSLSSEKSTLNPHAKEFKLNPNAKSFVPSHPPLRPSSPVADSTYYYSANVGAATQIHGMPVGIGIGPYAQQPVIYNGQAATFPQPYYHPSGQQYGQQMMVGQSRPVLYMPPYPAELPYKNREF